MRKELENINLNCPLCKRMHTYKIEVDKSHVIYNLLSTSFNEEKSIKKFKRIFLCPEKDEMFEAILTFEDSFGEIIEGVKVVE